MLSPCMSSHEAAREPRGMKEDKGPPRAQSLQLELATLSFPASCVLHRHNIISAHGCRLLLVCSHKSASTDKPAEMRGAAQVSQEQPWQITHKQQEEQNQDAPASPGHSNPQVRGKKGLTPRLGPVTLGGPFQNGANTWRKHWKTKTPENLENGWICVYPRPSNHIKWLLQLS